MGGAAVCLLALPALTLRCSPQHRAAQEAHAARLLAGMLEGGQHAATATFLITLLRLAGVPLPGEPR